ELQEREHDVQVAALAVEKNRQDIARQVREARLNYESAKADLVAAEKRAVLAERAAELLRAQYEVGMATQLELLDAERTLTDAQTGVVLAQLQVDVNQVSLERVTLVPPATGAVAGAALRTSTDTGLPGGGVLGAGVLGMG